MGAGVGATGCSYTLISLLAFLPPLSFFPSLLVFPGWPCTCRSLACQSHLWIFGFCVVDTLLSAWILMLLSSEMDHYSVSLGFLREGGADLAPQWTNPAGEKPCCWEVTHLTMVSFDSKHSALAACSLSFICVTFAEQLLHSSPT